MIDSHQPRSIKSILSTAATRLIAVTHDQASARFEVNLLLQHTLNVNLAWILGHDQDLIAPEKQMFFEALIAQRIAGQPIAYILGEREFYGLTLNITPDTLIPRPDTETLVDTTLSLLPSNLALTALDLGTGSGAIALAIAKHRPLVSMTAVDFSEAALQVAIKNAHRHHISNIVFLISDWFDALSGQLFNIIVSNPPYVKENDPHLYQGDLRFEPQSALTSGADGLKDIRKIIELAPQYLKADGWLILEHGYNQADEIANLLKLAKFIEIAHVHDLAGIRRVTLGRLAKSPYNQ
jgi:release factor glutamine methyltransferase